MKTIRGFQILAAIMVVIAAYFLWQENRDGVFISLVLGASAYFISFRFQVRARIDQINREREPPS